MPAEVSDDSARSTCDASIRHTRARSWVLVGVPATAAHRAISRASGSTGSSALPRPAREAGGDGQRGVAPGPPAGRERQGHDPPGEPVAQLARGLGGLEPELRRGAAGQAGGVLGGEAVELEREGVRDHVTGGVDGQGARPLQAPALRAHPVGLVAHVAHERDHRAQPRLEAQVGAVARLLQRPGQALLAGPVPVRVDEHRAVDGEPGGGLPGHPRRAGSRLAGHDDHPRAVRREHHELAEQVGPAHQRRRCGDVRAWTRHARDRKGPAARA